MKRVMACVVAGMLGCVASEAQWILQESHTTASLRGIHSVDGRVAWASGTGGTVLRTVNGGKNWQACAVPPGAEKLDFRGVQAFDAKTAVVMSSGKGDLSRLYKTVDGCATWKLVLRNPDADGFFDALTFEADVWGPPVGLSQGRPRARAGYLLGDPVKGRFVVFQTQDSGETWTKWRDDAEERPIAALPKDGAFAASNTSLVSPGFHRDFAFVSGGAGGSRLMIEKEHIVSDRKLWLGFRDIALPLAVGESAGAFSVAARYTPAPHYAVEFMVVGGDYQHPDETKGNATFVTSIDDSHATVSPTLTPPHGYRSAVTYDKATKTWITVGPNGTDVSSDDGSHWRALKPFTDDAVDADKNWNALSLPFVVGPKGRIGVYGRELRGAAK